jgi:deoxyadenosine/deoxycytidine kinase
MLQFLTRQLNEAKAMSIVIEGIDASGKSTLAAIIARRLALTIVESEGPPRYVGEMNHRVERYGSIPRALFVRHPCVSQPIYGKMRSDADRIDDTFLKEFYDQKHLFIYCDPLNKKLEGHVLKSTDRPEHVDVVDKNFDRILLAYRNWAIEHAHVMYRIGDSIERVIRFCEIHYV